MLIMLVLLKFKMTIQYCLFYALELMRIYESKEMPRQRFLEYRHNFKRQQCVIKQIMRRANIPNIPLDLPEYSIEDWSSDVLAYNDQEYETGKYKIFAFNPSTVKPIYTSQTSFYTHPLLLYHYDQHFDGIRTMSSSMDVDIIVFTVKQHTAIIIYILCTVKQDV